MGDKGKHASGGAGAFYRDLGIMVLGIIVVGVAAFFIVFLIADNPDASTTVAESSTTSTTAAVVTSLGSTAPSTSAAPTSSTIPVRAPEDVRVVVLNSIRVGGVAGRMTASLEEAGYEALPAGNYSPEVTPSRIWYREGFSAEANELLSLLPGADVEALPDEEIGAGADVVLVLGTGYEG